MKVFYKTLKIIGIIALIVITLMIITVSVAKIFEDKLAAFTLTKLENEINAPMSIGKVSVIPLFSFPRLSADINKLYIGDPKSKDGDTIFFINSLKVGLDSWDLINGVFTIDQMEISGLEFDYIVDSLGVSNIDFIINTFSDTSSKIDENNNNVGNLDFTAEKLRLKNISVSYYDSLNKVGASIAIPEINIKASGRNNIFSGKTDGSFIITDCFYKDTRLNRMNSCTINFELDYENDIAIIKELSINTDGINLDIEGTYKTNDKPGVNASIEAKNLDLNILKKYIPNQENYFLVNTKFAVIESIFLYVDLNSKDERIFINKLELGGDGIDLGLDGTILMEGDTVTINSNIGLARLNFDNLKKYIPNTYTKEYGIMDMGGTMDISGTIEGQYADSSLLPICTANVSFYDINIQIKDLPKVDALNAEAKLSNGAKADMSEAFVDITKLELLSNESSLQLDGSLQNAKNPKYTIESNIKLNLKDFESLLPDTLIKNPSGKVNASISSSGIIPSEFTIDYADHLMEKTTISLLINDLSASLFDSVDIVDFSTEIRYSPEINGSKKIQINDLNLQSKALNLDVHNSSLTAVLSGKFSDSLDIMADLQHFNIHNGKSQIMGIGSVNNLLIPEYEFNASIFANLEDLIPYVPDSLIRNMSGSIKADIKSKGILNLDSLEYEIYPLLFDNSSFDVTLNNISIGFTDSIMNIDSVSANIGLKNDELTIDDFSAVYNGLSLEIDSSMARNIYKAIILNQKTELYAITHIKIGDVVYDDLKNIIPLGSSSTEVNGSQEEQKPDLPVESRNWTYLIHGSTKINSLNIDSTQLEGFNINRLNIDDISLLFKLTDSSYIIDKFKLQVFDGDMINSFNYRIREDGTQTISTHNIVNEMDIRKMMRDLDNFGLDSVITYENISGLFSTDLNMFFPIDDSIRIDKMIVSGDLVIEKGGVYNYAPATEISKFTSIKELDNIQFKTLRSNIFMFKNKLYVPRTNIVSNALDIAAFGMQDLGGGSEYHLELHLSNILFGKSKKRNEKQSEYGDEINKESLKKSSQKIKYTVTEKRSKVGRDTKESREQMMNKIRVQKKMLDFIFFPKIINYNTEP